MIIASMSQAKKKRSQCEWCGKPSTTKCSKCHHFVICSPACMKSAWAIHARVCRRVSTKPYVTSPESSMYGVGEVDFEAAHRQLKGEYCLGEDGKPMMLEPYESEEERPDYFLMLPEGAWKLVVGPAMGQRRFGVGLACLRAAGMPGLPPQLLS